MSRHDADLFNNDDIPDRRNDKGYFSVSVLLLGGLVIAAVLVGVGFAMFRTRDRSEAEWDEIRDSVARNKYEQPTDDTVGGKRVFTTDEFKTLVLGKTTDAVIAAVGRPDKSTFTLPPSEQRKPPFQALEIWTYSNRVLKPTGEVGEVKITFQGGIALSVE